MFFPEFVAAMAHYVQENEQHLLKKPMHSRLLHRCFGCAHVCPSMAVRRTEVRTEQKVRWHLLGIFALPGSLQSLVQTTSWETSVQEAQSKKPKCRIQTHFLLYFSHHFLTQSAKIKKYTTNRLNDKAIVTATDDRSLLDRHLKLSTQR